MQSFLSNNGLTLFQTALAVLAQPPSLKATGVQVGSLAGFVPDSTMTQAQGTLLVDRRADATSVKISKVQMHETILTAILDRDLDFTQVGNVVFFINDVPTLWLVSETGFPKLGTDLVAHFAGDKAYLSVVFRFPYIEKIMDFSQAATLQAKWPHFDKTTALTVPQHTLSDQCVVEQNNLYYGGDYPFIAIQSRGTWRSIPLMQPVGSDFYHIDGGQSSLGD